MTTMNWLMLRGLAREKRHYGAFPETFERLMPGHRTFPMDLVGFGALSQHAVPWTLAEIVEELRARFLAERPRDNDAPWSIFAISLGGMVALEWAARYPQDFARVVVANTSAGDLSKVWERFMPAIWPRLPGMFAANPLQSQTLPRLRHHGRIARRLELTVGRKSSSPPGLPGREGD